MRVLLTADTVGGVWPYTIELARALAAEGIEPVIATMGRRPSDEQRGEAGALALPLFASEYRLPWMDEPWGDVAAAGQWLLGVAREVAPDLVHLSEPVYAALPWPVPTVAVAHSCVLSWWEAVRGEPAPVEWHHYRQAMRAGFAAAGVVVAPSRFMQLAVRRHYAARGVRVIPNARDPARFPPRAKEPRVFAAGRMWDQAKYIAALESAAAGLAWPVYVAGDTEHPGRHGARRNAGASPHLQSLGRLSATAVAEWQARASIYALPARYEPFGLSILEAALAECALVVGDVPSLRELWDGVAIFVDPGDADMLHDALALLIADTHLRQTLAMRAHRRAATLTPRRMAAAYLDAYATAAKQQRAEAACAS
jgi:glycosyltransferase involved in cell wall biosynthesis